MVFEQCSAVRILLDVVAGSGIEWCVISSGIVALVARSLLAWQQTGNSVLAA